MINPDICHRLLAKNTVPALAYNSKISSYQQKIRLKKKFIELTGLDLIAENAKNCPPNFNIEFERDEESYKLIRFTFDSEIGETVPCYLVIPKLGKEKYPVAITMQGHSSGFHNSIGEIKYEEDKGYQPRGQFALQAARNGYIALAIEQRGMGERNTPLKKRGSHRQCQFLAMTALQLGRTIIGERIWDISRAIDMLSNFKEADTDKILITGNSGGGTISYYAACYDERIKLSVPSCSFCPYPESILDIRHCICNYIPSAFRYFDMQDLASLILPRRLAIIAGKDDEIFPIDGVRRGFNTVRQIYSDESAEDKCRLVITSKGHWWCEDIVWKTINDECRKLEWI